MRERLRSAISFGLHSRSKLDAEAKENSNTEEENNRDGSATFSNVYNNSPRSTPKQSPGLSAARVFASAANSIRIGKSFVAHSTSPREPNFRLGTYNDETCIACCKDM